MLEARHITEATIDRVYLGLQGSMDTRELIEMIIECHNEVLVAAGIDLVPHTTPQAPAVRVKGLEWHLSGDSERWTAMRPYGECIIVRDHRASADTTHGWYDEGVWRWYASFEAAKAAAFADYEQRIRSALEAETGGGEHPDDLAVDRFATAMKAKLKWERDERNRSGWQDMSAADLSRLLYEHLPKGDPIDVANLAMMLHQNGQQIEAPATTTDERAVEALRTTTAHLVAAVSLLKRGGKKAAPSDKMFRTMIADYEKAIAQGRAALAQGESGNG